MATSTELDPRKSFTSTRFRTSRYPSFYSRGVSDTSNVDDTSGISSQAAVSPLRGVGLGIINESDGPTAESTGKQYSDMTTDELDQEKVNRDLAKSLFGLGVPETAEDLGKKALGLLASASFPGIGPLTNIANRVSQPDFDKALGRIGDPNAGVTTPTDDKGRIGQGPKTYSDPADGDTPGYDLDPNTGAPTDYGASPDDRGFNTPQPDYSNEPNETSSNNNEGSGGPDAGNSTSSGPGEGEDSSGAEGGPGSWHTGGPVIGRNPMVRGEQVDGRLLEGENVNDQATVQYWGQDVLDAMAAVAHGTATPEQAQLLLMTIRQGAMESLPQDRPNPMDGGYGMQPTASPLRGVGRGIGG